MYIKVEICIPKRSFRQFSSSPQNRISPRRPGFQISNVPRAQAVWLTSVCSSHLRDPGWRERAAECVRAVGEDGCAVFRPREGSRKPGGEVLSILGTEIVGRCVAAEKGGFLRLGKASCWSSGKTFKDDKKVRYWLAGRDLRNKSHFRIHQSVTSASEIHSYMCMFVSDIFVSFYCIEVEPR